MVYLYILLISALLYLIFRRKDLSVKGNFHSVPRGPLKGGEEFIPFQLIRVIKESHDTNILRFGLDPGMSLGVPIGHHLALRATVPTLACPEGEVVTRNYTPISALNDTGYFDLMVKEYQPTLEAPDRGKMSRWLTNLPLNSTCEMSGPLGTLRYRGGGVFNIGQGAGAEVRKVKRLGLVAGGTGITPCFQIIHYLARQAGERMEVHLVYANKTENSILLKRPLDYYSKSSGLNLFYVLEAPPPAWTGGVGRATQEILEAHLPAPSDDVLILLCGPSGMNSSVWIQLLAIGHQAQAVYIF